jgi:hypothetical protein
VPMCLCASASASVPMPLCLCLCALDVDRVHCAEYFAGTKYGPTVQAPGYGCVCVKIPSADGTNENLGQRVRRSNHGERRAHRAGRSPGLAAATGVLELRLAKRLRACDVDPRIASTA